jgi:hypothetical protein
MKPAHTQSATMLVMKDRDSYAARVQNVNNAKVASNCNAAHHYHQTNLLLSQNIEHMSQVALRSSQDVPVQPIHSPGLPSTSAAPHKTPTWTSQNAEHISQVVPAVAMQLTQLPGLPSTSAVHCNIPTGTFQNAEHMSQVVQAVALQHIQFPALPSTSAVHCDTPAKNTGTASSLSSLAMLEGISKNSLFAKLIALRGDVWGEKFCLPCQVHGYHSKHAMVNCSGVAAQYFHLKSKYHIWKAKWNIPNSHCFWCCIPTVCVFSLCYPVSLTTFLRKTMSMQRSPRGAQLIRILLGQWHSHYGLKPF